MKKIKPNLTEGSIFLSLLKLALPIMGTSFIQMAYSMTDMIWIGRVGSSAVASVGTAGFLVWFGFAFIMMVKVGAEVGVSQSIGRDDRKAARNFARNSLQLITGLAVMYGLLLLGFRDDLIAFFKLGDQQVVSDAISYLSIVAVGMVFMFINPVFSGIYNGSGDSMTPFWINSIGLVINIIFDPILIFGYFGMPKLGVEGAAFATVFSQLIVTLIFLVFMKNRFSPFKKFIYFMKPDFSCMKQILKFGYPVGLQSSLFTIFSILIARIIAQWGPLPIAVQKVGSQIEALSWMTASGFSSALSAFTGQNFGAQKWDRIYKGYFITLGTASVVGVLATYLLYFHADIIFGAFIPETEAIAYGVVYLKILALSQLFMCIEIVTAGAFNGLGKTLQPAVVSIVFTGMRVPVAIVLSSATLLGLNGVWWSISMSSVVKGVLLVVMFLFMLYRHPKFNGKAVVNRMVYRFNCKLLRDKRCLGGKS